MLSKTNWQIYSLTYIVTESLQIECKKVGSVYSDPDLFFPGPNKIGQKVSAPDPQHCFLLYSVADPGCLSRIPDRLFSIPDPGSAFFLSRIRTVSIPDPGSRIRIKEFKCFNPKNGFKALEKMIRVVHPGSRIRMLTSTHPGSRIQGPKRHQTRIPDPQHCSCTTI